VLEVRPRAKKLAKELAVPVICAIFALGIMAVAFTYAGKAEPAQNLSVLRVETEGGHGSAVSIGNGLAITAAHVIEGREKVKIITESGHESDAKVVWIAKDYDIALLETVDADYDAGTAKLNCSDAKAGTAIRAVGNPGDLEFAQTHGVVAGKAFGPNERWASIQAIDATVVPGMSGGPVFNKAGEIVGITVAVQRVMLSFSSIAMTRFGLMVPSPTVCKLLGRG